MDFTKTSRKLKPVPGPTDASRRVAAWSILKSRLTLDSYYSESLKWKSKINFKITYSVAAKKYKIEQNNKIERNTFLLSHQNNRDKIRRSLQFEYERPKVKKKLSRIVFASSKYKFETISRPRVST